MRGRFTLRNIDNLKMDRIRHRKQSVTMFVEVLFDNELEMAHLDVVIVSFPSHRYAIKEIVECFYGDTSSPKSVYRV